MKKEDFIGKFILRAGDLKPEEITSYYWRSQGMTISYCQYLKSIGMLFNDKEDAEQHYRCVMGSMKMPATTVPSGSVTGSPCTFAAFSPSTAIKAVKPRIYLSGPISNHDLEERRQAFKKAQTVLEAEGFTVFNPMENGLSAEATTHDHMHRDLAVLTNEDIPFTAIYMMTGWLHSAGCKLEFDVATAIGLSVIMETDEQNTNSVLINFK